jgi:hypothetical protein
MTFSTPSRAARFARRRRPARALLPPLVRGLRPDAGCSPSASKRERCYVVELDAHSRCASRMAATTMDRDLASA